MTFRKTTPFKTTFKAEGAKKHLAGQLRWPS